MATFSALRAHDRAAAVLDAGTFQRMEDSPADSTLVVGSGLLAGVPVAVAFTDGHVRGGTLGVGEAGILAKLADITLHGSLHGRRPLALILGFDTGGVRVEEGPRALAAASAVGVALARLSLIGVPMAGVISGPRGCFGALAVMAGLPDHIVITQGAHWGLTGPRLFADLAVDADRDAGFAATSGDVRLANGDVSAMVSDATEAVREDLCAFVAGARNTPGRRSVETRITDSAELLQRMRQRLCADSNSAPTEAAVQRRRDLLRYSFRRQWVPGPLERSGLLRASLGVLGGHPALGLIIGPEQVRGGGVGIEEAALVTEMIRRTTAASTGEHAAILSFLFCQGHAVDLAQERFGLPRALAECLRCMVGARLLGHPIISILGGGTYGAAYLALAAPSHRILAMRGTSIAPMAPQVLRAFQGLRGAKTGHESEKQLAELIPDIRIVESVIRLPRVLREELYGLLERVRPEVHAA